MAGQYGYAGKLLRVDLSSGRTMSTPTMDYAEKFIGGMGIAARIYWDEAPPDVKALDPGNPLIFVTGPLAGFTGLAGSMWQVHAKSPLTIPENFTYGSLGGNWGAQLKFAGYDGIVVQGKSEKPVYLFIDDDTVQLRDASALWGRSTIETQQLLKRELGSSARVAAVGPAGEHLVSFATILADKNSSASVGLGAVMGSKNLKAVVARGHRRPVAASPERLRELSRHLRKLREGARLSDFGLIPGPKMKKQLCYGCINGCFRAAMKTSSGDEAKYMCQSAALYQQRARRYYGEWNEVPFYANRLCDDYGVDTRVIETMLAWLTRCYRAGILTEGDTALPLSKFGSLEFIESLVKQISLRDGFGDILARGTVGAADAVGSEARALITDYVVHSTGQSFEGDPRMDMMMGLLHAMQPREHAAIGEVSGLVGKWREWVSGVEGAFASGDVLRAFGRRHFADEDVADFTIDRGKGRAVKTTQDRWSARESLIVCGFAWPTASVASSEDHVSDPSLEAQVLSAVTGRVVDEASLNERGEAIFNLRRAIFAREGRKGRESEVLPEVFYSRPYKNRLNPDDPQLIPGKDGKAISNKGAVVDRERFETLKDEYYQSRQWDVVSGLQSKSKLEELGLDDVAEDLGRRGLAV